MLQIIKENPQIIFDCWGSFNASQSNIGGSDDDETIFFINALKSFQNVLLHGAVSSAKLAKAINTVDALLICYDVKKDQSKGTNYHKVMEYISTGKVVIANNITTYKSNPELIQMNKSRESNYELPALFKNIISNLNQFNSRELQQKRINYAAQNTYVKAD